MTVDTNINYTLVGTFVLALITFIVLAIIWLSSGFAFVHYKTYAVYIRESVSGLSIDSPVEFNGVDVGNVSNIQLNPHHPEIVTILLKVKSSTPITQGTIATLNSRGITGGTYVALKDKSTNLAPLLMQKGERYPVIPSAPSLFLRIDAALKLLSADLHQVSRSISKLLDRENQLAIKHILRNLQNITGTLSDNDDQLVPLAYETLYHFNTTAQNLTDLSNQLKNNPSIILRGESPPPLGPGE